MRLTPEQFAHRKENRITGAYEITPPNTERRGRKALAPICELCGRETEYLFKGPPAYGKPGTMTVWDVRELDVCQRCRPLSNLEAQELAAAILHDLKKERAKK